MKTPLFHPDEVDFEGFAMIVEYGIPVHGQFRRQAGVDARLRARRSHQVKSRTDR